MPSLVGSEMCIRDSGGCLGGNLYVDMTDHFKEETFKQKCSELRNMILDTIGEDVSRYGGPLL